MIIGDFNGRVSNKLNYIEQDNKYVQTIDSYDYIPNEPLPRAQLIFLTKHKECNYLIYVKAQV